MVGNYSKTSESLWQYCRNESNDNLGDSGTFKSKIKITRNTPNDYNTKDVEIVVLSKYLRSYFWRTLKMPLINCEHNLILTWSSTCDIINSTGVGRFTITETKRYVPVVTLSTQDNAKLLQKFKPGFKRTINWNKYQSDPKAFEQNQYLNHLIDPRFQGLNRLFILSFENENGRKSHSKYYLRKVEIKDYNVKIDDKNFFDQPVKNDKIT